MRTTTTRLVILTMLALLTFTAGTPAQAAHTLEVLHVAQPVAPANQDLVLPVAVRSSCSVFCGPVSLSATYERPDGTTRTVRTWVSAPFGAPSLTTLTIPAADVRAPRISYVLRAEQTHCMPLSGACHTASARAPSTGSFSAAVVG